MGKKKGRKGQQFSEGQAPTEAGAQSTPLASEPSPPQPQTTQSMAGERGAQPQVPHQGQQQMRSPQGHEQSQVGGRGQLPQTPHESQTEGWSRGRGQGRGAPPARGPSGDWSQRGRGQGRGGSTTPGPSGDWSQRGRGQGGGAPSTSEPSGVWSQRGRGQGRGAPTTPGPSGDWSQRGRGRGGRGGVSHLQGGESRDEGGAKRSQEVGWGGARPRGPSTSAEAPPAPREELPVLDPLTISAIKPGTVGRAIRIETNHVRLNLGSLTTAYRYDVSIEPQKKPKRMLREAMELFRQAYYPRNHPSYDGQKLLYSAKSLPLENDTISGAVTIQTDRGNEEFKITVKLTGTLSLTPLRTLLQKKNMSQDEVFQCVEVVMRQAYVNSFVNVGRRFYTSSNYDLGCGAVMYLGGFQAAVQGSVPFMNVDVAHKAFTKSTTLINLIVEMCSTRNRPLTEQDVKHQKFNLNIWQIEQINEYLRGLKVLYEIPALKKVYRVNELVGSAREEKFQHENNTINVEQYFQIKYHIKLQYPHLPTVWVGSRDKRICVPIEFCRLKEGQPLEGNRVLGTQTSKMIGYSATSTTERKKKIQGVMKTAAHNQNPYIQEFGFSIGSDFERLTGRVLDPPTLQYIDGIVKPRNGAWWAKKFKNGASIKKWTVLGFGVQQDRFKDKIKELAKMILDYGNDSGMKFAQPAQEPFEYIRNDQRSLLTALEKKSSFDLVVVVFTPNKDSYYMVKQVAEQRIGLLTQCVKTDTLYKLKETTVRNILLKINCKMNGTNHVLQNLGLITDEPCMVMGADVTHPGPQARTIPSVVAVTASHDRTATGYNISVTIQEPRTEIIQGLDRIVLEKLHRCKEAPKRIYFFRDGVSDGEFERVRNSEVAAIKKACQIFYKGAPQPKLTFIVVQKRHHTRFFPLDKDSFADRDKYCNVPPGTYVDTVITDPTAQNFYLLSHQSIKGVGRPTKYQVLCDENDLSTNDVKILAFYLCHLYTRCNRAVSYPAPTYFAHLAADRAKGYLHAKQVDLQNLDQRLVRIEERFATRNPMFFS